VNSNLIRRLKNLRGFIQDLITETIEKGGLELPKGSKVRLFGFFKRNFHF